MNSGFKAVVRKLAQGGELGKVFCEPFGSFALRVKVLKGVEAIILLVCLVVNLIVRGNDSSEPTVADLSGQRWLQSDTSHDLGLNV